MVSIHIRDQRPIGWENILYKDKQSLFWVDGNTTTDDIRELAHGEVVGDQVLLLVDGWDVALVGFFDNDLCLWCSSLGTCLFEFGLVTSA